MKTFFKRGIFIKKILTIAEKGLKKKNLTTWGQVIAYQNRGWKIIMAR